MGALTVVNFVSIDGVIQSPLSADEDRDHGFQHGGWVVPYSDETVSGFMRDATVGAAGMVLGRRSYQIFTEVWSQADESEPAVAAMNEMTKWVVSRSLDTLSWSNSRLISDDMPTAVRDIKQQTDGDLVVFGSGGLVCGLVEHDLVDAYKLLVFPVVLGAGKRMFGEKSPLTRFALTETMTSQSGVAILTYTRRTDIPAVPGS